MLPDGRRCSQTGARNGPSAAQAWRDNARRGISSFGREEMVGSFGKMRGAFDRAQDDRRSASDAGPDYEAGGS